MYIRKYITLKEKVKVEDMMNYYIRPAFGSMLENNEWMDDRTKARALKKFRKMKSNIGYPREMSRQSEVESYYQPIGKLSKTAFLQNNLKIGKFGMAMGLKRLRKKISWPRHWTKHSSRDFLCNFPTSKNQYLVRYFELDQFFEPVR